MKISTLFRKTYQNHLYPFSQNTDQYGINMIYSCNAVRKATIKHKEFENSYTRMWNGMANMGCPVGSFAAFDNVPLDQRQNARLQWLMWCELMAKEQGV
jgi:hypothetical protein